VKQSLIQPISSPWVRSFAVKRKTLGAPASHGNPSVSISNFCLLHPDLTLMDAAMDAAMDYVSNALQDNAAAIRKMGR
jgi:hypothetical protein